jgi:hypothetical protein
LSKILGHSSVAVTEAHYAHLLKVDLVAASQQVKSSSLAGRRSVGTPRPRGDYQGNAYRQEETADCHGAEESE